ncbi:MAG: enoyl-CoA hydratase/isomerase family protein [Acidobacteria bacterium]|nr:enoyl-CoA hydratase/isomerase family protein [Acidobacteriota bacterium]
MRHFQAREPADFGFKEILCNKQGRIATVTINRPRVHNCLNTRCIEEIAAAFQDISDDDSIGVAVLTGTGDRAFCTGADVREYTEQYVTRPRDYWKYIGRFRIFIESILRNGKPTIARLNGITAAGGNEAHLACDLSVMAEHAYIKQAGTHVGSVAAAGATQWLPITVGDKRTREILFLNRPIPSAQALQWGMTNQVVPSVKKDGEFVTGATSEQIKKALESADGHSISLELLDRAVAELADALLESLPECTRYTKEQINFLKEFVWNSTVGHAREWLALHYTNLEPWEGMTAFAEKRKANYKAVRERWANDDSPELPWGAHVQSCPACGAKGLPARFSHCGNCGAALVSK